MPFTKKIPMHDQWIGICAEKKYRVLFLNSCFIEYRVHDNNATRITGTKKQTFRQRFLWRYYLLKAFLSRFLRIIIHNIPKTNFCTAIWYFK